MMTEHSQTNYRLPSLEFPLRENWRITLPAESFIWSAPVANGNVVAARCGHVLAGLDSATGQLIWHAQIAIEDIESKGFTSTVNEIIVASPEGYKSRLSALEWEDGDIRWETYLPGHTLEDTLIVAGDQLHVIAATERGAEFIYNQYTLDLQSGKQLVARPAPSGAAHMLSVGNQLFIGSESLWVDEAGLYRLTKNSDSAQRVLAAAVGRLRYADQTLVLASEQRDYELIALSVDTLDKLWSTPIVEYVFAVSTGEVAYVEPLRLGRTRLVLCNIHQGTTIWRSKRLAHEALFLYFIADSIAVQDETGINFFTRSDGTLSWRLKSPEWPFSWGAALTHAGMIVGHRNELICYRGSSSMTGTHK